MKRKKGYYVELQLEVLQDPDYSDFDTVDVGKLIKDALNCSHNSIHATTRCSILQISGRDRGLVDDDTEI